MRVVEDEIAHLNNNKNDEWKLSFKKANGGTTPLAPIFFWVSETKKNNNNDMLQNCKFHRH